MAFSLPSFLLGLLVLPVLAGVLFGVIALYGVSIRTHRGGGRATTVIYSHQVGEHRWEDHEHEYSGLIPRFIRLRKFKADQKRCVFGKLHKTTGAVLDDEIELIVNEEVPQELGSDAAWSMAERIMFTRYRDGRAKADKDKDAYIQRIAEHQLLRENVR